MFSPSTEIRSRFNESLLTERTFNKVDAEIRDRCLKGYQKVRVISQYPYCVKWLAKKGDYTVVLKQFPKNEGREHY